jgi:hypothetical protein
MVKTNDCVSHLEADLPFSPTRPEILIFTSRVPLFVTMLFDIKPTQLTLGARLMWNNRAPSISARELALAPGPLRKRRKDKSGVKAKIIKP